MSILIKIFFISSSILILSGCSEKYAQKDIPEKKQPIKVEKKSNKIEKKSSYNYCNKHKKIMTYASNYITKEFKEGYFSSKDVVGAKAQLFLVENNSPTIFAQNINAALKSYRLQYNLARKNGCNIKNFLSSPLIKIKGSIKYLEKQKLAGGK
jgi:hypothetical protein